MGHHLAQKIKSLLCPILLIILIPQLFYFFSIWKFHLHVHTQQYIFSSSLFRLQTNPTSSPVHMENFLHHMSSMVPYIIYTIHGNFMLVSHTHAWTWEPYFSFQPCTLILGTQGVHIHGTSDYIINSCLI